MTATRTPILPGDIKKGDTIRCEYGHGSIHMVHALEYKATADEHSWSEEDDCTHFLLQRPVPPVVLPDVPGVYSSINGGGVWQLLKRDGWFNNGQQRSLDVVRNYAPFTRLRPESEVAAEVLAEVGKAMNLRMVPEQGTGRVVLSLRNFRDDLMKMSDKWATK